MDSRPNVIFILSDDQGPWAAGCYGNPEIRTPTLDRLAAEGMLFEDFFCTSPVCSPARASILTGTIPSRHGVHDWIRGDEISPNERIILEVNGKNSSNYYLSNMAFPATREYGNVYRKIVRVEDKLQSNMLYIDQNGIPMSFQIFVASSDLSSEKKLMDCQFK